MSQRSDFERTAIELESLFGISVDTVAALLGLVSGKHGIDESLLPYESIDLAGLLGKVRQCVLLEAAVKVTRGGRGGDQERLSIDRDNGTPAVSLRNVSQDVVRLDR